VPTMPGMTILLQTAPPAPSAGYSWGIWYVLVVVAVGAFVGFWVIKRLADIIVKRKTASMIREVGEPTDKPDFSDDANP
jgi:hypothetical protein